MLFIFDKKSLLHINVTKHILMAVLGFTVGMLLVTSYIVKSSANDLKMITEETRTIIIKEHQSELVFSEAKLREYILELNLKFPHIVYAQAKLESGNFNSIIFKKNCNLFGMKVARRRPTTNKGEVNGHAFYDTWQESVVDYAFWQAKYMSELKTEKEYLEGLGAVYAEDPLYIKKLTRIIGEDLVASNK